MKLNELYQQNIQNLSENDLEIWSYIDKNRKKCANLSIEELAKATNVSRTTILRFAKRIGLSGFSELKVMIKMENEQLQQFDQDLNSILDQYSQHLERLKDLDVNDFLKLINSAQTIYVCYTGLIQKNVAKEMKRMFMHIGKMVYTFSVSKDNRVIIDMLSKQDIVIFISYSGNNLGAIELAKKIKMIGIPSISLSVVHSNELSEISDLAYSIDVPNIYNPFGPRLDGGSPHFLFIDFLIIKYINKFGELYDSNR